MNESVQAYGHPDLNRCDAHGHPDVARCGGGASESVQKHGCPELDRCIHIFAPTGLGADTMCRPDATTVLAIREVPEQSKKTERQHTIRVNKTKTKETTQKNANGKQQQ